MREIAIEGLDGAGKSTIAEALVRHYRDLGQEVHLATPYRAASQEHGEIYPLWESEDGARQAIKLLKGAFARAREQADDAGADLLIFDRHWMTAFSEIGDHPELVDQWGNDLTETAYLRVSPETARIRAVNDESAAWMDEASHAHYAERYESLCKQYGAHLLGIYRNDNDVALDSIVQSIVWDMNIAR
jgi:thymidylate kinase